MLKKKMGRDRENILQDTKVVENVMTDYNIFLSFNI